MSEVKQYPNQICFNDWASYNAGRLNIKWFKAGTKAAEVVEFLTPRSPVQNCNHLEIYVADTSLNWPSEIDSPPKIISEHCGIDDALNILALFDAASDYELKAAAFLLYQGIAEEFEEALTLAGDVHIIEHNPYGKGNQFTGSTPEETLGFYWVENGLIEVPDHVERYFNYKQLGRELLQDNYTYFAGDIYEYTN